MRRFTVTWMRDAQDELAELWLDAADRESVTHAANRIDTELAQDPSSKGVELHEGLRALEQWPLRVVFEILNDDRIVEVAAVWQID